jgi:methylthioribose-1-phosphate isomerase
MIYIESIKFEDDQLKILDQTLLPESCKYILIDDLEKACEAIINLRVRGAPAIGVMAAFSVYIEIKRLYKKGKISNIESFKEYLKNILQIISKTRPTAVNLFYALNRIEKEILNKTFLELDIAIESLKNLSLEIFEKDKNLCDRIGENGEKLIFDGANILTHCNTGSLATSGRGTALGAIYTAYEKGKKIHVYNTETRPLLQGSRLTSFELNYAGIPNTLITDNMVASLFKNKAIDMVMVGADRITKNGDTANKIGTYSIAILANYFNIPFYVLAPSTSIDRNLNHGDEIIIEERNPEEVKQLRNCRIAPQDVKVYNPAFDVTPSRLITSIITEKGIFRFPYNF